MKRRRCAWVPDNTLYREYHDKEWGVPVHNDPKLFELLILEGAQAGLSWETVLKKRESYGIAYDNFDPKEIAGYTSEDINQLLLNPGIIRNRLKINSSVSNAKAFLRIAEEFGSFNKYIWSFVNEKPIQNELKHSRDIPGKTELSDAISRDLKKRGFKFVGGTIIYAFMQSIGMVNDHEVDCFRYREIKEGI